MRAALARMSSAVITLTLTGVATICPGKRVAVTTTSSPRVRGGSTATAPFAAPSTASSALRIESATFFLACTPAACAIGTGCIHPLADQAGIRARAFSSSPPSRARLRSVARRFHAKAPQANPLTLTVAGAAQALHLFPVQPGRFAPGAGTRVRVWITRAYG